MKTARRWEAKSPRDRRRSRGDDKRLLSQPCTVGKNDSLGRAGAWYPPAVRGALVCGVIAACGPSPVTHPDGPPVTYDAPADSAAAIASVRQLRMNQPGNG